MPAKPKTSYNSRVIQALVLFALVLALLNIAFVTSEGWIRLVWGLLGLLFLWLAYRQVHLNLESIGLAKKNLWPGLKYSAYVIAVFLVLMLAVFLVDKAFFQDARYDNGLVKALYLSLLVLPLKTILFEELAFRGILPAILLKVKNDRRFATVLSAGAFGLWHVSSAAAIGNYTVTEGVIVPSILVIAGIFLTTSTVGYLLLELRWRSGSLVAPIVVHWFINGFGIILASLSWQ